MEFIDSNRKKTSTENPHIPEIDTAYKIGYEAASEVLEMEPLKTATVLANANLTPERIEQIDQQVVSLCGYYTAYEALHSKKTTAKDFPGNPFALFLHLIKDGARNFDLTEFDSKGIVKAEIFVQKENDVIPYTWTGSNRKNIYYNK